ncbi:FKBP-type peptidyl-prolyl cis-trans isomerase [soil metagenome]
MRKSVALTVAAGLLVALAGCSSAGDPAASCTPVVSAGPASNLISAPGSFGTAPTVDFGTPLDTTATQATVLVKGTGPTLPANGVVSLDFVLADGHSGTTISKSPFDGKTHLISPVSQLGLPGLESALTCATEGSRLAVAISPQDGFGQSGAQSGIPATDSLVMVIDVVQALPDRANGAVQPAQSGFPSVVLGSAGRPGITIPSGPAPTELKTAVLQKGSGPAVADGDGVWVQYTAVSFIEKAVTASTWADSKPVQVTASSTGPLATSIVPSLVGQTVGSQYITVVPAGGSGTTASAAAVYVVDVLGITPIVMQPTQ